jgi:hypothetical protein
VVKWTNGLSRRPLGLIPLTLALSIWVEPAFAADPKTASEPPDAIQTNSRYLPVLKAGLGLNNAFQYDEGEYLSTMIVSASIADEYGFYLGLNLGSTLASRSGAYFGGPPEYPTAEIAQRVWGDVDSWVDINALAILPLTSLEDGWTDPFINVIPALGSSAQFRFGSFYFRTSAQAGVFWANGFDIDAGPQTIRVTPDPTVIVFGEVILGFQSAQNFAIKAISDVLYLPPIPVRVAGFDTTLGEDSFNLRNTIEADYLIQTRYTVRVGVYFDFRTQEPEEFGFTLSGEFRL